MLDVSSFRGLAVFFSLLSLPALAQLSMPLQSMHINSPYGYRKHPVTGRMDYHRGIDLSAREDPVFAILPGRVISTTYDQILGKAIRINHQGLISIYGHLSQILVTRGDSIKSGALIGISGATGRVTGPHLHFSLCLEGIYIDPLAYFIRALSNLFNLQSMIMETDPWKTLEQKLSLLTIQDEVFLTQQEVRLYGAEFADREEVEDG
jgi:murein DD-endopeptidase MepM/ murein hydrolase activator NlpD